MFWVGLIIGLMSGGVVCMTALVICKVGSRSDDDGNN